MQCLLDKVTARHMVRGLFKLGLSQDLTINELLSLQLFSTSNQLDSTLFIAAPTANVLHQFAQTARYTNLIQLFLGQVQVVRPARYQKRWARRLRRFSFAREDAAMLALATFGVDSTGVMHNIDYVATFDQPMINHWATQQAVIRSKLSAMQDNLPLPYRLAALPRIVHPEVIISHTNRE